MRTLPPIREISQSVFFATFTAIVATAAAISAQQIQFGFMGRPSQVELTAPHVEAVSGATTSRLEQARALLAGRNWDEAVDIYRELAAEKSNRVVSIGDGRYVNLRTYCQLQLARLPEDGLAAYRRRVDVSAEQLYRQGFTSRDEHRLERVVNEYLCSSWGDDALMALGELALERGEYSSARRCWEQISPLLRSPDGQSMWLALRDIDLDAKWPEVEKRLETRKNPAEWLAYPDTRIDLADVRARLVLVSIRAGELDRAAIELQVLKRLHPHASGQLGGQNEEHAIALERLLSAAREWQPESVDPNWPTFAGSHSRSKIAGPIGADLIPIWTTPIKISPPTFSRSVRLVQGGAAETMLPDVPRTVARESLRPLSTYSTVVGGKIVFADGAGIHAARLDDGQPAIATDGVLRRNESVDGAAGQQLNGAPAGIAHGVPRLTVDLVDGVAFARVGPLATTHVRSDNASYGDRIIGLDLRREGLLTFQTPREESGWSFDGAPVCDGRRVFVAMRQSDVTPRAYVACFDAATGAQQWRTAIGAADTPSGGEGDEITHNLLTLVEDRIYFNTNLGLVAALEAESGDLCWISRYERFAGKAAPASLAAPLHFDRDPSPCVYHDGLLIVAPSDAAPFFALDAVTGKLVWEQNEPPDVLHVIGVVGKNLIVSGKRIAAVDVLSGRLDWVWPESEQAGVRGMGRGVIAGNEIFWPTRNEIYALDPKSGAQTRSPISLKPLEGGSNLAASQGRLVVAGYDGLMLLGPANSAAPTPPERAAATAAPKTGRVTDRTRSK